jgi:flagellar P-ring protein precursor FlgI
VEREVPTAVGQGEFVHYELNATDFATVQRVVEAINRDQPGTAVAVDGRQVRVLAPVDANQRVAFLGRVGDLEITPAQVAAKVIVNSRTGSVVMNQTVKIENCAVAHGNLSVAVTADNAVSQPGAFSGGQTAGVTNAQIDIKQEGGGLSNVKTGASLADVVKALNAIGANPQDLIAILQAMKTAGALRAELEII